jgi:hypothetical protein
MSEPTYESLEPPYERLQAPERPGLDAVVAARRFDFTSNETDVFEDLQVLGYGRLRERQFIDEVSTNTGILPRQKTQDFHPCWVPDSFRKSRHFLICLFAFDGTKVGRGGRRRATGIGS